MNAVLTAGVGAILGAVVPLLVGALVVSSERLRGAASSDLELLDRLTAIGAREATSLVRSSLLRNAVLSATRSRYPLIFLSEALAIIGALALITVLPTYSLYRPARDAADQAILTVAVLGGAFLYGVGTLGWLRRAVMRADTYAQHAETRQNDAREAVRQIRLMQGIQAVALGVSLLLAVALMGYSNDWPRWVLFPAVLLIPVVVVLSVYLPLTRARVERRPKPWKHQHTWKRNDAPRSLWQVIDAIEVPGKYPDRS